jgi:hypothetical protein
MLFKEVIAIEGIMFLDFTHRLMCIKKTTFRKLDLFPSSGEIKVASALLGPLERVNLNHWTSSY